MIVGPCRVPAIFYFGGFLMTKTKKIIVSAVVFLLVTAGMLTLYFCLREAPEVGSKEITVTVTANGESTVYPLKTDALYLRGAMDEIEGLTYSGTESAEYGMMIDTVNGIYADYVKTGFYWSFYVNGGYCNYGIDTQPVNDGDAFEIVLTPASPITDQ